MTSSVPYGIVTGFLVLAQITLFARTAIAESFDERWSIIPKANAGPAPVAPQPAPSEPPAEQLPGGRQSQKDARESQTPGTLKRGFFGKASFYAYSAGKTASGAVYNRNAMTAAHRSLPFGTRVRVIDVATNRAVVVTITDRGPWIRGRVLDLSLEAARNLGITEKGVADVRAEIL